MRLIRSKESDAPLLSESECIAKTLEEIKPGCGVFQHLAYVGAIASALWNRLSSDVQSLLPRGVVVPLAALHDIGKASPGFQRKIWRFVDPQYRGDTCSKLVVGSEAYSEDHAYIGHSVLNGTFGAKKWFDAVGAHHGAISEKTLCSKDEEIFGGPAWQKLREGIISRVLERFPFASEIPSPTQEQIELATAFVVVADWLGSDERFSLSVNELDSEILSRRAEEVLDEIGWTKPVARSNRSFAELFAESAGGKIEPNEMQLALQNVANKPGVYVVEAPTGLGKTEAALWCAYRMAALGLCNGVYFALPTRTTSDRIHERVRPFLESAFDAESGARLVHGLAWTKLYRENKEEGIERKNGNQRGFGGDDNFYFGDEWFRPSKRALLQTFGVGTIDQALMGAIPLVKHYYLRLFGLAGKVVVFDEVHSYDAYTSELLDSLIEKLSKSGSSVVVLSATLTKVRREKILDAYCANNGENKGYDPNDESYPAIAYRYCDGTTGRVVVTPPADRETLVERIERDDDAIARQAVEKAEKGELVLCVVNTIDKAQELYRLAKSLSTANFPEDRLLLLHGRFPARRREEIESRVFEIFGKRGDRSKGALLISTQVVEQSVDIDADYLITDLAPTDLLVQRIGRLWRHSRPNRKAAVPIVTIVYPPERGGSFEERLGVDACVYPSYVLWRSAEDWNKRDRFRIPSDVRSSLENVHAPREERGEAAEMLAKTNERVEKMRNRALFVSSASLPTVNSGNEILTRYNDSESLDFLLMASVDEVSSAKGRPTFKLLSGDDVTVDERWRLRDAVKIAKNVVSRRKRAIDAAWAREASEERLCKIFARVYCDRGDPTIPVICDRESGKVLTLDGKETPFNYSEELGLWDDACRVDASGARLSGRVNDHEREEDEEDDGFYEDFEW